MPVVVEIVARLGDTVIDHAHVAPGGRYRLADRTFIAKPGTYQVGLVAVTMERTFRVEQPVPRKRIAMRPIVYAAVSLALHLALLVYALVTEPYERMTARTEFRPYLFTRIDEPAPPPPPAKHTEQPAAATAAGQHPAKRQARKAHIESGTPDQAIASLAATMGKIGKDRLADVGPVYNEDDANSQEFGNHLWDIDNDPDFATVKTPEGYDTSGLADTAMLYGLTPEKKTHLRFELQTRLAHKSAAHGDCFPAHRIAKWIEKLDRKLFASMYLADPVIVACLRQEVDPRVQWHGKLPN